MKQTFQPVTGHAKAAFSRLRDLCESSNSVFAPVLRAAEALAQARAPHRHAKAKINPDFRTVVATVLDAQSYNAIPPLAPDGYDEDLDIEALDARRAGQATRLAEFLLAGAGAAEMPRHIEPTSHALAVIDAWQPTAREPSINVRLLKHIQIDVLQHLAVASMRMDWAVRYRQAPAKEDIEHACAVVRAVDPARLTYAQDISFQDLKASLGIIATNVAQSNDEAWELCALLLYETLFRSGDVHAGVHVALMRLEGWGTGKKGRDLGMANDTINTVSAAAYENAEAVFNTLKGYQEFLRLRARVKKELITEGKSEPQIVFARIREYAETLLVCLANHLPEFGEDLAALIDPHSPIRDELRTIVDGNPDASIYCRNLHESLAAACRDNGMELPDPPLRSPV